MSGEEMQKNRDTSGEERLHESEGKDRYREVSPDTSVLGVNWVGVAALFSIVNETLPPFGAVTGATSAGEN